MIVLVVFFCHLFNLYARVQFKQKNKMCKDCDNVIFFDPNLSGFKLTVVYFIKQKIVSAVDAEPRKTNVKKNKWKKVDINNYFHVQYF